MHALVDGGSLDFVASAKEADEELVQVRYFQLAA